MGKPEVSMSFSCGMEPGIQSGSFCVRPKDDPQMMAVAIKGLVDAAYEAGKRDAAIPAPHPAGEPYSGGPVLIYGPGFPHGACHGGDGGVLSGWLNIAYQQGYDKAKKEGR